MQLSQLSIHTVRKVYIYKVPYRQRSPSKYWFRIKCIWNRLYIEWQKRKSSISFKQMLAYGLANGILGKYLGAVVVTRWRF